MNILLTFLLLFALISITSTQRSSSKKKDEVKKIVKIIEFENDRGRTGRRHRGGKHSSSSSEEQRDPPRRPPSRPPSRPPARPRSACDEGWLEFDRPNGPWCVLVGGHVTNGQLSYDTAQSICHSHGAVLTGLQNNNERMRIADEGLKQIRSSGKNVAGLWLGAQVIPTCRVRSCGPFNTFRWTDGDTTGVDGFSKWGINEPDNDDYGRPCLQQFIMTPDYRTAPDETPYWKQHFQHGDLDKFKCGVPTRPPTRLYACGKRGRR